MFPEVVIQLFVEPIFIHNVTSKYEMLLVDNGKQYFFLQNEVYLFIKISDNDYGVEESWKCIPKITFTFMKQ